MAKKKFFIKTDEKDAKKKALEHFNTDENRIDADEIMGGWREYGGKKDTSRNELSQEEVD
jgi:hypothetical protein